MPVLDLSPRIAYRGAVAAAVATQEELERALLVARWPGVVLPPAEVLGSAVIPVVRLTGACERARRGWGPMLDLETVSTWEVMPTPLTPAAPLSIVGFIDTAKRWGTAINQARSLAGLGAGMVLSRRRSGALPLMDADATGVLVVVGLHPAEPEPRLWVIGRVGAASTARRIATTRLMEEALFAHALRAGVVS